MATLQDVPGSSKDPRGGLIKGHGFWLFAWAEKWGLRLVGRTDVEFSAEGAIYYRIA